MYAYTTYWLSGVCSNLGELGSAMLRFVLPFACDADRVTGKNGGVAIHLSIINEEVGNAAEGCAAGTVSRLPIHWARRAMYAFATVCLVGAGAQCAPYGAVPSWTSVVRAESAETSAVMGDASVGGSVTTSAVMGAIGAVGTADVLVWTMAGKRAAESAVRGGAVAMNSGAIMAGKRAAGSAAGDMGNGAVGALGIGMVLDERTVTMDDR